MQFIGVKKGVLNPIYKTLSSRCNVIDFEKDNQNKISSKHEIEEELSTLKFRHWQRRSIRWPLLFKNRVAKIIFEHVKKKKLRERYAEIFDFCKNNPDKSAIIFNGFLGEDYLLSISSDKVGMKKLFCEGGYFQSTMQCDVYGINAWSSVPINHQFYDDIQDRVSDLPLPTEAPTRISKLRQKSSEIDKNELPSNYTFIPFQVPSDSQILGLSPWIEDMPHLYSEIYELAEKFTSEHFVIKEHPSFRISIQNKVKKHPRIHFANHVQTATLVRNASSVITVNSSVGLESINAGKTTFVLGESLYAIEGICLRVRDREELHTAFQSRKTWVPNTKRRDTYLRFIYSVYLLPFDHQNPPENVHEYFEKRVTGSDLYGSLLREFPSSGAV